MKLSGHYILLILSLLIIIIGGTAFLFIAKPVVTYQEGEISSIHESETSIGPESPLRVPVYTAVYKENGSVEYSDPQDPWKPKIRTHMVPSEEEAPSLAERVLARFGGIPNDAYFAGVKTGYIEEQYHDPITGSYIVTERIPMDCSVRYNQISLSGSPLIADNFIEINFGDNGEIIRLRKNWRTFEPAGDICIISPAAATEKLLKGAFVYPDHDNSRVTVTSVRLGYYYGDLTWIGSLDRRKIPEIMVEPVWIFNGTSDSGGQMQILVPAKDATGIADATCTNLPLSEPVKLNFTLPQQHLIETSGTISVEAGRDTVARFMDIPNDSVQYNGKIMKWCGNYRYVQYEYIVKSITVHIDKKTGDIVYTDYTKVYPDSDNITISLDKGRDIARQYAVTIVPEFSKNNIGEPETFNITKGPGYPRNVYRYTWQRLWIEVDPETGNILHYENWNRIALLQCAYKETRF